MNGTYTRAERAHVGRVSKSLNALYAMRPGLLRRTTLRRVTITSRSLFASSATAAHRVGTARRHCGAFASSRSWMP